MSKNYWSSVSPSVTSSFAESQWPSSSWSVTVWYLALYSCSNLRRDFSANSEQLRRLLHSTNKVQPRLCGIHVPGVGTKNFSPSCFGSTYPFYANTDDIVWSCLIINDVCDVKKWTLRKTAILLNTPYIRNDKLKGTCSHHSPIWVCSSFPRFPGAGIQWRNEWTVQDEKIQMTMTALMPALLSQMLSTKTSGIGLVLALEPTRKDSESKNNGHAQEPPIRKNHEIKLCVSKCLKK